MVKICFPHYKKGDFASMADALKFLNRETYSVSRYALCEIVQYNTCYRNHLRRHGVEDLIMRLTEEAPQLKEEKVLLHRLREWAAEEKVADYDIQCYNIKDNVTILGHTFNGLEDVIKHQELIGKEFIRGFDCFAPQHVNAYSDIHIGELYENYPIFDSYDLGDDRTYQNYIFRKDEITKQDMEPTFAVYHKDNFCMVHEQIPEDLLPILYYSGEGKYMLLASAKV